MDVFSFQLKCMHIRSSSVTIFTFGGVNASLFQRYAADDSFDKAAEHKAHIDAIMASLLDPSKRCPCVLANNMHRVDCIASQETEIRNCSW